MFCSFLDKNTIEETSKGTAQVVWVRKFPAKMQKNFAFVEKMGLELTAS